MEHVRWICELFEQTQDTKLTTMHWSGKKQRAAKQAHFHLRHSRLLRDVELVFGEVTPPYC